MEREQGDKILVGVITSLIVIGLIMISSAGVIYSQTRFGDGYYFFKHQLLNGIIPGAIAMYFLQKIDYHFWKKLSVPFFFASIIFLVLVFIPGVGSKVYGASRWIQLGPFSFQPSEMIKLSIILYLAAWLQARGKEKIGDFHEGLLPFLGIFGVVAFLIIKQPDTGTLGVITMICFSIYFVSGAKVKHLTTMALVGFIALLLLVIVEPYRMDRITAFLDPEHDPKGIGYQINQALIAVGSGGVTGQGIGHSRQKFNYLPEPVGDSIFAIIGEETGLIGAMMLVILYTLFAMRGMKIAKFAPDEFGKLIVIGIVSWVTFQAFINISANVALIPLTGIPLPFVSYGGTSLVFLMSASGILINVAKQSRVAD